MENLISFYLFIASIFRFSAITANVSWLGGSWGVLKTNIINKPKTLNND